jgi:hypothetical protein
MVFYVTIQHPLSTSEGLPCFLLPDVSPLVGLGREE